MSATSYLRKAKSLTNNASGIIAHADDVTNITKYGPHIQGPLSASVANAFRGGVYTERILTEDLTVYRVHNIQSGKVGSWFTATKPLGSVQAQIDLALNPQWGNRAESISVFKIPKGTKIYEGFVEQQIVSQPGGGTFILHGGGTQIYVPDPDPKWLQ
jgi:hypothetical protein